MKTSERNFVQYSEIMPLLFCRPMARQDESSRSTMIRRCGDEDFEQIRTIINDGASAYRGAIPGDCWIEPYMSMDELRQELAAGVTFWGFEANGALQGVMGLQSVQDVTLIRHAYVLTSVQRQGIGASLLLHLRPLAKTPMLIGTWADAHWAIHFYEKHGFRLVGREQARDLMQRYWTIPQRQLEVSVVLAEGNRQIL
jgi:GNAT superfamily N-acetyltransferase